jgi:ABC-type multidrug transport system ATPase subunit
MIELKNIGLKYSSWILKDLNLSIHKGETVGLIGRSGSGKTSLLKLIACQVEPTEGGVYFNEMKLVGPVHKLIPGYNDIQLIDQDFGLEPYHTVEENIKEKILNLHLEDRNEMVQELLGLLELNHVKNQKAKNLSGGEQQRVAIARALACEPEVLLLDEPFVHLDQNIKIKIITYLKKLAKIRQMTLILASHDGSELMGFVDRVIHIEKGVVKREAVIEEMFYSPEDGKVVGEHRGAHYFTVGQRKGLMVGGSPKPLFVISTDVNTNTIYVGQGDTHPGLMRAALLIKHDEMHWVREDLKLEIGEEREFDVRIRYRQPLQKGKLISKEEGVYILFDEAQRAVAPGQFAAWYENEELIGSGVIS